MGCKFQIDKHVVLPSMQEPKGKDYRYCFAFFTMTQLYSLVIFAGEALSVSKYNLPWAIKALSKENYILRYMIVLSETLVLKGHNFTQFKDAMFSEDYHVKQRLSTKENEVNETLFEPCINSSSRKVNEKCYSHEAFFLVQ